MVLKLWIEQDILQYMFESSVNSDGTQTDKALYQEPHTFESSVNSDGTQTLCPKDMTDFMFESSVNSDGTQTCKIYSTG